MLELFTVSPRVTLIDLDPPVAAFRHFLGAYVCHGDKVAIIDVGPEVSIPNLVAGIEQLKIDPARVAYLILTHIHIDHAGGVGSAVKNFPNARVVSHSRAFKHLVDPKVLYEASLKTLGEMAEKYGEITPVPADRIQNAEDNMTLDLGQGLSLRVLLTPGHAPHHLSVYDESEGVLFAGETAGVCSGGVARPASPPPFSYADEMTSLDKLIALKAKILCYGHFGAYDNAVQRLEGMKKQLQLWHEIIKALPEAAPEVILAYLRRRDPALAFLNSLPPQEFTRESVLLINGIIGLRASA